MVTAIGAIADNPTKQRKTPFRGIKEKGLDYKGLQANVQATPSPTVVAISINKKERK